jgi:phosphohistidine phosphatase
MEVVLLRHGIAAELSEMPRREGPPAWRDSGRPLTDEGRRKVLRAGKGLRALGVRPDVVLHSGLLRAAQTAELVAESVRPRRSGFVVTDALEPDADPRRLFSELAALRAKSVLAVGHAPNLDRVIALACGAPGRLVAELGKAGAACLELPDSGRPAGRLVWLLTPKLLRKFSG